MATSGKELILEHVPTCHSVTSGLGMMPGRMTLDGLAHRGELWSDAAEALAAKATFEWLRSPEGSHVVVVTSRHVPVAVVAPHEAPPLLASAEPWTPPPGVESR